ncbi:hypothetical protein [Catellatospora tritici]|uniref:hypothetical protein n=1 Tax=Catellatospora tritici TaxID=2851566 RepID=UPI001C2D3F0A|nr:hypothetical protein [Catellatospora tritici]MBV1853619.1 hypothetical protein [Catellatospora tritici]
MQHADLAELALDARLLGADRLYALAPGTDLAPVRARDTLVLVDADTASWSSWNRFADEFAADTGARVVRIDDGGVTGPGFFDDVRRLGRPVVNSPKGQTTPVPPDLSRRQVTGPEPCWTWALVSRRDETRIAVHAAIEALTGDIGPLGLDGAGVWLPTDDPFRPVSAVDPDRSGAASGA